MIDFSCKDAHFRGCEKNMTVSKDAENRPVNSLPGFEAAYGKREGEPSPRMEAKPRLIPVDRKQMRIVPVDVERLIPYDHEARAIWEFVGSSTFLSTTRRSALLKGTPVVPPTTRGSSSASGSMR